MGKNNCRQRVKIVDAGQLEENPGYLKEYRESHPEYVKKNREAQRVRDRRKKLHLDIRAQLKRQVPEITNQLWDSLNLPNLDIQAQLDVKTLEMTFVLSTLPCLDIQVQLDRAFHVKRKMSPFPTGGDNHVRQKNSQCFTGS